MTHDSAEDFVRLLYEHLLERVPMEDELSDWTKYALSGATACDIMKKFTYSKEYIDRNRVQTRFPPGHYYSPIVDPSTVTDYIGQRRNARLCDINGIRISLEKMIQFWNDLLPVIKTTPFTDHKLEKNRFYYLNGNFPYADAVILRAMIGYSRPNKIIEIGSGFSSACMLDAIDHFGLKNIHMTCIDPDPVRLHQILRNEDRKKVDIIKKPVQEVPLSRFAELQEGDILFIDSTHVLKTGSDVHYELLEILPNIKPGILIHFHDIHYPFEYPDSWISTFNHSWNEIYAVRAFLMYNYSFDIVFWHSLLAMLSRETIENSFPLTLKNTGGSLWIRSV